MEITRASMTTLLATVRAKGFEPIGVAFNTRDFHDLIGIANAHPNDENNFLSLPVGAAVHVDCEVEGVQAWCHVATREPSEIVLKLPRNYSRVSVESYLRRLKTLGYVPTGIIFAAPDAKAYADSDHTPDHAVTQRGIHDSLEAARDLEDDTKGVTTGLSVQGVDILVAACTNRPSQVMIELHPKEVTLEFSAPAQSYAAKAS